MLLVPLLGPCLQCGPLRSLRLDPLLDVRMKWIVENDEWIVAYLLLHLSFS